jgi:hypothetical protein
MAYMNQERKAKLAPAIKAHCAKYGVKASIGVRNHSTLVVKIKSGKLDFCNDYFETCAEEYSRKYPHCTPLKREDCKNIQVNQYHVDSFHSGKCREFLSKLVSLCNIGNHDNSDIMTDYFDVGWYLSIDIGTWNKPYEVTR